ncbi:hypothetical protein [Microbacterium sp. P5_E9]
MSARVRSSALTARMLRRRPGAALLVAGLAIILSGAAVAVPAALRTLSDRVAQEAVDQLAPGSRDLQSSAVGLPQVAPAEDDATGLPPAVAEQWGVFDGGLESARAAQEPPLAPLLGPAEYVVRTPEYGLVGRRTQSATYLLDPRIVDHAVLSAGAWPAPPEWSIDEAGDLGAAAVEMALSTDTADELGWSVGEERVILTAVPGMQLPLRLSGTFDAAPGSDDYWYHVPSALTPHIRYIDLEQYTTGAAVLAPEALELVKILGRGTTQAWYPLDPAELSASDAETVVAQLRAFTANPVPVANSDAPPGSIEIMTFATSTIDTLEAALATQSAMSAVFAITASGPVGAAIALIIAACRVIARSRRAELALLSARGASPGRLRALQAWHGVWYGSVPALGTAAIGVALVVGLGLPVPPLSIAAPFAVAALAPAILALLTPPGPRLREELSHDPTPAARRWRLAVEGVVVALTVLAIGALVSGALRGERVGTAGAATSGVVLAVPLLAALVGGMTALRLYPLPLRAILRRRRAAAGLTGFLGAARALRERSASVAPVLALVIGISSAVTSAVLLGSIAHQIDASARASVGADMQVARADLGPDTLAEMAQLPGVAGVAGIGSLTRITIETDAGHVLVTLLTVDPQTLGAVQDAGYPLVPTGTDLTAPGSAVPFVAAAAVADQLGEATDAAIGGAPATMVGVSAARAPEGITGDFAVIDAARAPDITDTAPSAQNALIDLETGADAAQVQAAVRDIVGPDATILTADAVREKLQRGTGTAAITTAFLIATAATALFAAIAVVLSLVLSAASRERTMALLRAIGTPAGVGRGLAWWDLWPSLAAALVFGLVVGLSVPALLLATVDFGVFAGATPSYHLDPLLLVAALAGFVAMAGCAAAVAVGVARRVRASAVLRDSQEG